MPVPIYLYTSTCKQCHSTIEFPKTCVSCYNTFCHDCYDIWLNSSESYNVYTEYDDEVVPFDCIFCYIEDLM
jgi:hypothetical protein